MFKLLGFRPKVWHYLLCSIFAILVITLFSGTTYAHTSSRAEQAMSPVGTWHATDKIITGPLKGLQVQEDFTFTSNGTVSSLTSTGLAGAGTWEQTSPIGFFFHTDEKGALINGQLYTVHIDHIAIITDSGNQFIAYSAATLTDPNGNVTPGGAAIISATRA